MTTYPRGTRKPSCPSCHPVENRFMTCLIGSLEHRVPLRLLMMEVEPVVPANGRQPACRVAMRRLWVAAPRR
jgi:DTW domain-containing protein YfiP